MDKVRSLAWTVGAEGDLAGLRRLTPEGLYGRRKMPKLVQRTLPDASPGAVDRAMNALELKGVRRAKGIRTTIPGKDGKRAGDLLNRDFINNRRLHSSLGYGGPTSSSKPRQPSTESRAPYESGREPGALQPEPLGSFKSKYAK